jgi:hypothetical protein
MKDYYLETKGDVISKETWLRLLSLILQLCIQGLSVCVWFMTISQIWISSWDAGVLTAALLRIQVLRDVALCCWVSGFRRFEGTMFVQNVSNNSHNDTASYPRRHEFQEFFYSLKRSDQPSRSHIRLVKRIFLWDTEVKEWRKPPTSI